MAEAKMDFGQMS